MILTCPNCATRYFVADDKVGPEGREVRCAACKTRWTAHGEPALDLAAAAVAASAPPAEDDDIMNAPIAQLSADQLPKAFRARADDERKVRAAAMTGAVWAATLAFLALLVLVLVIFRADVVRLWPRTAGAYAAVGLPINRLGLEIDDVKAEPTLQNGHAALTISGAIRNVTTGDVRTPPISVTLHARPDARTRRGDLGRRVAGKIAAAVDPRIPSGETRRFSIVMLDPPSTAEDLEVAFVLDQDEAAKHGLAPAGAPSPAANPGAVRLRGAASPAPHH